MGFSVKGLNAEFIGNYKTVKIASQWSGYSEQYLRRILREGTLKTRKIGQIWLIDESDFRKYLKDASMSLPSQLLQILQYYFGAIFPPGPTEASRGEFEAKISSS